MCPNREVPGTNGHNTGVESSDGKDPRQSRFTSNTVSSLGEGRKAGPRVPEMKGQVRRKCGFP